MAVELLQEHHLVVFNGKIDLSKVNGMMVSMKLGLLKMDIE
jgi:hypothetical protein